MTTRTAVPATAVPGPAVPAGISAVADHAETADQAGPADLDHAVPRTGRTKPGAHDPRPPLARRERVLLRLRDTTDAPVVATTVALHHRCSPTGWRRLDWADTGRVRFDAVTGQLTVTALVAGEPHELNLPDPGGARLAAVIRERVAATVLASSRVPLDNGTTALVTARRRPDTAEVLWVVLLPDGVDPTDPMIQSRTDDAIRILRSTALP